MDQKSLIVQIAALGVCLWAESVFPLFMDRKDRLAHGVRNLAIGLINGVVLTLSFTALFSSLARFAELYRFGLLNWIDLPLKTKGIAGFIAFDLWMYGWHRANHNISWLWRFHRVHHSDPSVDSTSAYRFHIGEMLISSVLRLGVIPLLGIPLQELILYELILEPVIIFHHSNIAFPGGLDRLYRLLFVSPNMHRVHHSDRLEETNSNYASIFSMWDRFFQSYRERELIGVRYGLRELRDPRWHTFFGILTTPAA